MQRPRMISCATLALLAAGAALAADVSGKWTGEMSGPDGGGMSMTFKFKQNGTKLTGTMDGPQGEVEITDGKVEGNKISFTVSFENGDMKVVHEGTVEGDTIVLNVKMAGDPGGGPPGPITLKRAK